MASYTTNLNLKKPAGSENVSIGDINSNMDAIDQAYGSLSDKLGGAKFYGVSLDANKSVTVKLPTPTSTTVFGFIFMVSGYPSCTGIMVFRIFGSSVTSSCADLVAQSETREYTISMNETNKSITITSQRAARFLFAWPYGNLEFSKT